MEKLTAQQLAAHNKAIIMGALAAQGVTHAFANYSGDCDSGGFTDVSFTKGEENDVEFEDTPVSVLSHDSSFDNETREWVQTQVEWVVGLQKAIEDFTYLVINLSGHSGYENNEGGGGTVTFDVVKDLVEHDHYDRIVEEEHSVSEY